MGSGGGRQRGVRWLRLFASWAVAVWAAAHIVRGVTLGSPGRDTLVAVLVAALLASVMLTLTWRWPDRVAARALRLFAPRDDAFDEGMPRWMLRSSVALLVAVLASYGPALAAFWLAVVVCGAVGLPLHASGVMAHVVGAFVVSETVDLMHSTWHLGASWTARGARRRRARVAIHRVAAATALWSVLALDGARLGAGEGWRQVLVVGVLATLLDTLRFSFYVTGYGCILGLLARLPSAGLKGVVLWLVAWVGSYTDPSLTVAGLRTFVIGGLLIALVTGAVEAVLPLRSTGGRPIEPDPLFWSPEPSPWYPPIW